jgi:hypothetical protein
MASRFSEGRHIYSTGVLERRNFRGAVLSKFLWS